ncbi:hypothetical protein MLD38_030318 [Melastoma candidum]|uniref:Uncharacterized protein n=1 Tax=Melastoma candidum TaxID=119954 RepID=A0ACB9MMU8_9MYRT|nr:hypothetical protein MLD38_030318 [Melastoma candidum]
MSSTLLILSLLTMSQISRYMAQSGSSRDSEVASSTSLSTGFGPWKSSLTLKLMELMPALIFLVTSDPLIFNRSPRAVTLSIKLSLIFASHHTSDHPKTFLKQP